MKAFALLLLVFLAPRIFFQTGALLSFEANREYMAKAFCINKDKPELKCNGSCHLAEMLDETSSEPDSPILPIFEWSSFTLDQDIHSFPSALMALQWFQLPVYTSPNSEKYSLSPFRPPRA
jgi:hypothetical protein